MWLVEHVDGTCALQCQKRTGPPSEKATNLRTACGYYVIMPLGFSRGEPSCRLCRGLKTKKPVEKKTRPYKPKAVADVDDTTIRAALTWLTLHEVAAERREATWSYEHDDKHSMEDWAYLITDRTEAMSLGVSKKKAKKALVEIAALAVAALEAVQRSEVRKVQAQLAKATKTKLKPTSRSKRK